GEARGGGVAGSACTLSGRRTWPAGRARPGLPALDCPARGRGERNVIGTSAVEPLVQAAVLVARRRQHGLRALRLKPKLAVLKVLRRGPERHARPDPPHDSPSRSI